MNNLEELRNLAKSAILSLTEDEVKAVLAIMASEASGYEAESKCQADD